MVFSLKNDNEKENITNTNVFMLFMVIFGQIDSKKLRNKQINYLLKNMMEHQ